MYGISNVNIELIKIENLSGLRGGFFMDWIFRIPRYGNLPIFKGPMIYIESFESLNIKSSDSDEEWLLKWI